MLNIATLPRFHQVDRPTGLLLLLFLLLWLPIHDRRTEAPSQCNHGCSGGHMTCVEIWARSSFKPVPETEVQPKMQKAFTKSWTSHSQLAAVLPSQPALKV